MANEERKPAPRKCAFCDRTDGSYTMIINGDMPAKAEILHVQVGEKNEFQTSLSMPSPDNVDMNKIKVSEFYLVDESTVYLGCQLCQAILNVVLDVNVKEVDWRLEAAAEAFRKSKERENEGPEITHFVDYQEED